jgi:hypothetical protein
LPYAKLPERNTDSENFQVYRYIWQRFSKFIDISVSPRYIPYLLFILPYVKFPISRKSFSNPLFFWQALCQLGMASKQNHLGSGYGWVMIIQQLEARWKTPAFTGISVTTRISSDVLVT